MMRVQICIIGTGMVGTSLALALKRQASHALEIHGYDIDTVNARHAQQTGGFDRMHFNAPSAADQADAVFLAVPQDALPELLGIVLPVLKAGSVLTDTAYLKGPTRAWAAEHLPDERYYVAGRPVLSPASLHNGQVGPSAARADLFEKSMWALAPNVETDPAAVKLIYDLTRLAGSTPFFVDPAEHDSLVATADLLPMMSAVVLMRSARRTPEWHEARKLAGRAFATGTATANLTPISAQVAALLSEKEAVVAALETLQKELEVLLTALNNDDAEALSSLIDEAYGSREQWLQARQANDWSVDETFEVEMPSSTGKINQIIGGKLLDDFVRGNIGPRPS